MNSSVHVDNKKKDVLMLIEGPTQGLNGTTLTAEKKYLIKFTENNKKFCLIWNYNVENSHVFVYNKETITFRSKDSEINPILSCLGNISKEFSADNMKKKN